jgi:hypothetical protein
MKKTNLLKNDKPWNKAREKRTSCNDVLSPDRSVKPSIVAKTKYNIVSEKENNQKKDIQA